MVSHYFVSVFLSFFTQMHTVEEVNVRSAIWSFALSSSVISTFSLVWVNAACVYTNSSFRRGTHKNDFNDKNWFGFVCFVFFFSEEKLSRVSNENWTDSGYDRFHTEWRICHASRLYVYWGRNSQIQFSLSRVNCDCVVDVTTHITFVAQFVSFSFRCVFYFRTSSSSSFYSVPLRHLYIPTFQHKVACLYGRVCSCSVVWVDSVCREMISFFRRWKVQYMTRDHMQSNRERQRGCVDHTCSTWHM